MYPWLTCQGRAWCMCCMHIYMCVVLARGLDLNIFYFILFTPVGRSLSCCIYMVHTIHGCCGAYTDCRASIVDARKQRQELDYGWERACSKAVNEVTAVFHYCPYVTPPFSLHKEPFHTVWHLRLPVALSQQWHFVCCSSAVALR